MKIFSLFTFLVLISSGCAKPEPDNPGSRNSVCKYSGNSANEQYCATTYFQLLANPSSYEGERVLVQAWAVSINGKTVIFPTKDSLNGAETVSSIVLVSGSELEQINRRLKSDNGIEVPRRMAIGGVFKQNIEGKDGKGQLSGFDVDRFGALTEVDRFSFR
ncbi:hypothetical protein [Luteimonas salinilitoris]|uniref:Uncharacterized protein n=1 Tax=Luteimonas salinilitoris TaxID=3237697 RepID=A0ABV4HQ47_9GAMM